MTKHTIKKEKDFVQIPNSILTNSNISLKAKGVLALMLSLPNNWNFSIDGIASKCKESRESIRTAIKELESAGYVKRTMMHGDDGKIIRMEYEIFEEPFKAEASEENPSAENPPMDLPVKENLSKENLRVNNNKINNTKNNNTQSNPISSKNKMFEMDIYRKVIKENIEYNIIIQKKALHKDMIDEIVELMAETLSSKRKEITIASNIHSMADVRKRFMDINSRHIEYIIECVRKNTTKIANIKGYMLAVIFNAPATMDSYYTTLVNHDLYG